MAKNPLYNTAVYFASDRYDDMVVNDFLYQSLERSYERCLEAQKSVAMRKEFRGTMDQFAINVDVNTKYHLPSGTYTYTILSTILPIVDKKRFLQRYKNYQRPISLLEIATDTKTFSKRLLCSLDQYLYMKLDVMETNDRHTILILYPGSSGILPAQLEDMQTNKREWSIWTESQSKVYSISSLTNTILNSTYTMATIPQSSLLTNLLERPTDVNAWDIAITYSSQTGRQLLAVGSARFLKRDGANVQFAIDAEFGQMIVAGNSAIDVYLMHQPDRVSNVIWLNQTNTSPIITLPYTNNPQFACLSVYEYDKLTHMRKRRLDAVKGKVYYPNVFDFSGLVGTGEAMLVEVTEYPHMDSGTQFDCPVSSYISATNKYYPAIITSSSCPDPLKQYVPQKLVLDFKDYATSEYFGDIRGYKLDKLRILQKDNPYLNAPLTRLLDGKSNRLYLANGSPSELKFGASYVTDTSFISVVQPDEVLHFPEPQGYTTIKTAAELPMVFYYLNGEWTLPYHVETQVDLTYAFLPKTKIEESQKVYTDAGLTPAQFNESGAMTVECFDESTMASTQAIYSTTWNQLGQYQTLFDDHDTITNYSLSDLILYNLTTGEFYDKNTQFSVSLSLDEYRLKNDVIDEVFLLDRNTTIDYLLTSLSEIYATKDKQPIVLKIGSTIVPMDPLLENLPNGLSDIDGKKIAKETIQLAIKDPSLIGVSVGVALGTRGTTSRIPGTDIIQQNWDVASTNFTGVPNQNRIELYFGGTLILENEAYTLTLPTKMGGDLQIHLKKEYFTAQGLTDELIQTMDLYVNYLPIEMNTVLLQSDTLFEANFLDSELRGPDQWVKTNQSIGLFLDGTMATELLLKESTRLFCGGVRIPSSLLLDEYSGNTMNVIPVSNKLYGSTSFVHLKRFGNVVDSDDLLLANSTLVAKVPKRDLDLYDIQVKDPLENKILADHMRKKNPKELIITTNPGAAITASAGQYKMTANASNSFVELIDLPTSVPYDGTWKLSMNDHPEATTTVVIAKDDPAKRIALNVPPRKVTVLYNGPDTMHMTVNGKRYDTLSTAYGIQSHAVDLYTLTGSIQYALQSEGAVASTTLQTTDRSPINVDLTWSRSLSLTVTPTARYTIQYLGNGTTAGPKLFEDFIQTDSASYSYAFKVFGWWRIFATGVDVTKQITLANFAEPIEALVRIEKDVTITANQNRDITITQVGQNTPLTTLHTPTSADGTPTTVVWKTFDAGTYKIGDALTQKSVTLALDTTAEAVDVTRKINLPLTVNGGIDVIMTDPFGTATTMTMPITDANPDGKPELHNISVWHNAGTYSFVTHSLYDTTYTLSCELDVDANSLEVNTTGANREINFYCYRGYNSSVMRPENYYFDVSRSGPDHSVSTYHHEAYYDEHSQGIPGKLKSGMITIYREGHYDFRMNAHLNESADVTFKDQSSDLSFLT